jgi:hypothetical protein
MLTCLSTSTFTIEYPITIPAFADYYSRFHRLPLVPLTVMTLMRPSSMSLGESSSLNFL